MLRNRKGLVEDKISKTKENAFAIYVFQRLHHMWVMPHNDIGASLQEGLGIEALLHGGTGLHLCAPVQHGNNLCGGMMGMEGSDGIGQGRGAGLTNAWTILQIIPFFQGQGDAVEEGYLDGSLTDDNGF